MIPVTTTPSPLETTTHIAKYCGELYVNRNEMAHTVRELAINEQAARYLIGYSRGSTAGATLLCRQIFDIAYAAQKPEEEQRQAAGRIGGLLLILTDIVDGQIDRPTMPRGTKDHYLDESARLLLLGAESNFEPENKSQDVSFSLAKRLHESVIQVDERGLFAPLFHALVSGVKRQYSSDDLEEHLELTQIIGSNCALLGAASTEHVTGTEQPQARAAAASIGVYAQCLDHAYEMREDIHYGAPTYATLYLTQHGDTPANRKKARENLLDLGSDAYRKGLVALEGKQLAVYEAARRMLDVRYRLIKRIESMRNTVYV